MRPGRPAVRVIDARWPAIRGRGPLARWGGADGTGLRDFGRRRWSVRRARAAVAVLGLSGALLASLGPQAQAQATAPPPVLHAKSAALLDMSTGALLWSQAGRLRLPMASTTKLMTALVALRLLNGRTSVPMVVPPQVSQAYGELLYLQPGQTYTFLQLLEGMLLPSANDAAVAVAVDSAASESRFVALMNAEAQALGLANTHFANPDGLDDPDHYSSADDLAVLGRAAMANPVIRALVAEPSASIPEPGHPQTSEIIGNINALLAEYPGATGIKTGYTSEALNVIIGSARRGNRSVIAVLMGEPKATFWSDETSLLNYGFALEASPSGSEGGSSSSGPSPLPAPAAPQRAADPPPAAAAAGATATVLPPAPALAPTEMAVPEGSAGALSVVVPQATPGPSARPAAVIRAGTRTGLRHAARGVLLWTAAALGGLTLGLAGIGSLAARRRRNRLAARGTGFEVLAARPVRFPRATE